MTRSIKTSTLLPALAKPIMARALLRLPTMVDLAAALLPATPGSKCPRASRKRPVPFAMYLSPVDQVKVSAASALSQGTTSDVTAVACDATLSLRLAPAVLAMPWVKI